ncbi:hypothetical protein LOAG_09409 [Loa loa]|uniref:Uncharacterized protein n=1 Tax=Loa loa TaxID=7209 RepID=A0A1S0TRY3_LOALO|nr:hypothetical protein LOAG_09409 [Loa loa]EFO19085.1 hypothetical protein LOAG_09409 [Loa loa]
MERYESVGTMIHARYFKWNNIRQQSIFRKPSYIHVAVILLQKAGFFLAHQFIAKISRIITKKIFALNTRRDVKHLFSIVIRLTIMATIILLKISLALTILPSLMEQREAIRSRQEMKEEL